jgi:hypothetical protein
MAQQPYWVVLIVGVSNLHSDTDVLGRTPSGERSTPGRDLYLTTHNTQREANVTAVGGIRTRNSSKRTATEQNLKQRHHWDRPVELGKSNLPWGYIKNVLTLLRVGSTVCKSVSNMTT